MKKPQSEREDARDEAERERRDEYMIERERELLNAEDDDAEA